MTKRRGGDVGARLRSLSRRVRALGYVGSGFLLCEGVALTRLVEILQGETGYGI